MTKRSNVAVILLLLAGMIAGALYFRVLHERVLSLRESDITEQQPVAPPIATPTDAASPAQIYWASVDVAGQLDPVTVQIPLSADPEQRSRQLIRELVASPPTPPQRTVPQDVTLLAFYLLPDGTGVADFSDNIAVETPSGILSESLAVDSIVRTLAANVPPLRRLKLLIHGQESETLVGHVDLTGFFEVPPALGSTPTAATPPPPSAAPAR